MFTWNKREIFRSRKRRTLHFIGIGGTGMSALAQIALEVGYNVTGSDLYPNPTTLRLSRQGARIYRGHHYLRVKGADAVIYSSAINGDNSELQAARKGKIPLFHRSELLTGFMEKKVGLAVAGSHGKTSTAAMIVRVLREAGLDPAFALGGEMIDLGTNGGWGKGDFMVAEADESDGSFHKLSPAWEVITGIDLDHVSYYPGWRELREAFQKFIRQLEEKGRLIINSGDRELRKLVPEGVKYLTYGIGKEAFLRGSEVSLEGGSSSCQVDKGGVRLGELRLKLPGLTNLINALGAVAVGTELSLPFSRIARALRDYRGVHRRLELKSNSGGLLVVEDYAHHPTEIIAALEAVRTYRPRRLWCWFQPHRYSRLRYFARSLATALFPCDHVILAEVYHAFEKPLPGVSSALILDELKSQGHKDVRLMKKVEIIDRVFPQLKSGDAVIVMGAGDIGPLADLLVKEIRKE